MTAEIERAAAPAATRAGRSRPLLWASLGLLAVFALLGAGVAVSPESPWSQGLDDAWRAFVGVGPDSSLPGTPFAEFFQQIGAIPGFVVMMLVLPLLLVGIGRWRSALFVVAVQLAGPGLLSQLTKNLVDRPRPAADEAAGLFGPLVMVDHGSFPSGHAVSTATVIVTVLAVIPASAVWARRVWAVVGVVLAAGIVWQRTLINAHWFSDTVAGLIGGIAITLLLWWAFQPWLARDQARKVSLFGR